MKCNREKNNIELEKSGRISINEGCVVETQTNRINGMKKITSDSAGQMLQVHQISWPGKSKSVFDFKEKIEKSLSKLKQFDQNLYWHTMHHYVISYSAIFLIVVTIMYFYSKLELALIP